VTPCVRVKTSAAHPIRSVLLKKRNCAGDMRGGEACTTLESYRRHGIGIAHIRYKQILTGRKNID
jgi:hypothetical protein